LTCLSLPSDTSTHSSQPTQADIRRKNANFAARSVAGKKTSRPAKKGKHSVGTWVLAGMLFLLVGGSE
jgi:hypothetical protein